MPEQANIPDFPVTGRSRPVIENVKPQLDGGLYPVKRTVGEKVVVEADIFADGHDLLAALIKYRPKKSTDWAEAPMKPLVNDTWRGEFGVYETGEYIYTVEAWIDSFKTWQRDFRKTLEAGKSVAQLQIVGANLVKKAALRAVPGHFDPLTKWADELAAGTAMVANRALDERLAELMNQYPDRQLAVTWEKELRVTVDPVLARFGAWYEMFPRSASPEPGRHGTLRDCAAQLPRLVSMGFDVLYLPPIHPIGRSLRKGKNNRTQCEAGEPGSPWAIGAAEGGHKAVHPELGTLEDFKELVGRAKQSDISIALDIALQCSPDHPYVKEHPEWFRKRPDGSIQCAENPPKIYQDIIPFDFECENWRELWRELKSIFDFWIAQGVKVFRVDNPHTKSFKFWEWCIGELKEEHADLIFLAEAFTRPKVMYRLAKIGFTQSYNYFPWRNGKEELTRYFTELTQPPLVDFLRPNLWPNTPDILTDYLQIGGRTAFITRLVLAATLGAAYGIYGPAFELGENTPREPGSEEYLNSEKYEIRHWDLKAPQSLEDLIARVNRLRRENPALQADRRLKFHTITNDQLLAYSKSSEDGTDTILTVVNLDPQHKQQGWLELPVEDFRLDAAQPYQMHDLLTGARFLWKGARNYVELNPEFAPAHIFRLRQRTRSEKDFDYFT